MDFYDILEETVEDMSYNPYAARVDDEWIQGEININFLNQNFGKYETATEMKNATESDGLKLFFEYLVEEGKLQQ